MDKLEFADVFNNINTLLQGSEMVTVSIDGKSGSGKSTLTTLIENLYDCNVFHMDDFFLTEEQRTKERLSEIGGNIDYCRFKSQVIDNLKLGYDFSYQRYNCHNGSFLSSAIVQKKRLNIVEGVYSQHPLYKSFYDFNIFLTIDEVTQARRILKRSGSDLLDRYKKEWIPLENQYFNKTRAALECDLYLDTSDFSL